MTSLPSEPRFTAVLFDRYKLKIPPESLNDHQKAWLEKTFPSTDQDGIRIPIAKDSDAVDELLSTLLSATNLITQETNVIIHHDTFKDAILESIRYEMAPATCEDSEHRPLCADVATHETDSGNLFCETHAKQWFINNYFGCGDKTTKMPTPWIAGKPARSA